MAIDKKTVTHTAHLARIALSEEELERFAGQLDEIIGFINKLSELDTGSIRPTSHILPLQNVMRQDMPRPSLPVEETLKNAPQRQENFFVVPKIIE